MSTTTAEPYVYASLLEGRGTLPLEKILADPDDLDPWSVYSSVLELGERLLQEIADGVEPASPGWAWLVMQVQVPALRKRAGLLEPSEREWEVRDRFGIPLPEEA